MNINSNATAAIVDSLFRLVRDGSVLRGLVSARHRGAAGANGKQTALLLDRSRGALLCCVPIDRSICPHGTDAPRTSLLCLALLRLR